MKCATRSAHRCTVVEIDGAKVMHCNLCGEVVPWKRSLRDQWHALRERLAEWIAP